MTNQEFSRRLNTSIIKSKDNIFFNEYRTKKLCDSPAIDAVSEGVQYLIRTGNFTEEEAIIEIIKLVRELRSVWDQYITIEGLNALKSTLKKRRPY